MFNDVGDDGNYEFGQKIQFELKKLEGQMMVETMKVERDGERQQTCMENSVRR